MTGSGVGLGWSSGGTPRPESSYTHTDSPSSNTTPLTTSTLVAPMVVQRSQNPRNSFIDVAQVYAHRQSLAHPADPAIAMQQRMSMIMVDNSQYGLSSHGGSGREGSTGATVGSSGHSGQWGGTATTMPSDENDESLLVDPFKTNNNSMASLNQILEQGPPPTQPLVSTQPPPAALVMMPAVSLRRPPQPLPDMDISYQPPTKSLDPAVRPSRRTSALYQQSTLADRRSVAGWPTNMTGAEDEKSGANSWHRKRASVVIPEGTIPVRLWKEDAAAMATAAGTTNDDVSLRTQLASGTIPRIGIVSENKEGESTGTGAGEGVMGYRPSVRNGAAVFEGSMPRKMTASRSTSRSRLDDDTSDAQQNAIDSLGISDAPATATLQQPQQTSTYRRKWATGQIAVDDYNIQTAGLQSGGSGEDAEHVIVSLPSPRGCLLEDEYNYNHQSMGDGQDEYEYGMRSLPILLGRLP
ncbi:hypothetical protein BGX24_002473 [Mortierella sp. AD032]|nr:hypothetical protein BGX24_002473 [Mortierella sp. AD032]